MRKESVRYAVWSVKCKLSAISCKPLAFSFQRFAFRLFFLLLASYLIPHTLHAQSVSATVDRDKILLGEQITLELKAEGINTQTAPLAGWFLLPDTINHIEVVKRSPIDTLIINGAASYTQTVTLTSFDSGNWQLPSLPLLLQHYEDGKKDTLLTSALTIEVLPVDIDKLQQYHPLKDIIDVEVKPNYWLIAGIVLFALAAIGLAVWFFFLRKKKEQKPVLNPVMARSLFETTIEQLDKLQKEAPDAQIFYTKLDDICRNFIHNQLHIRALQLTNDELMVQLNVYMQPEARTSFYQLLRLINVVKFARYGPDEAQKSADINTAKEAVQHIYYHVQRSLTPHA